MAAGCVFCKIAKGEIPAEKVYEDESVVAFPDIKPVAKTHLLIVPKKHIAAFLDLKKEDGGLIEKIRAVPYITEARIVAF